MTADDVIVLLKVKDGTVTIGNEAVDATGIEDDVIVTDIIVAEVASLS